MTLPDPKSPIRAEAFDGERWHRVDGVERFSSPATRLTAFRAVWPLVLSSGVRILGDAWERGYGDLEWRGLDPSRVMPWYVIVESSDGLAAFGVRTGADTMVSWRIDGTHLTLEADLRAIGAPLTTEGEVAIGEIRFTAGTGEETAFAFARRFCGELASVPARGVSEPVWGINDWYYAYGSSTRETILRDTALLMELAPDQGSRPFSVVDMGWAEGHPPSHGGPQSTGNRRFGDMASLAGDIRSLGARPGIWYRPLAFLGPIDLPRLRSLEGEVPGMWARDPSHPDVLARIHEEVALLRSWGYELIKHDFSTFDLAGRWGFAMDAKVGDEAAPSDSRRSTAQILKRLYATMREAAGDALLIGCDTVGHLAAGSHEIQRTGDDTSGREWARTAKMGPNTLAMRMPQHGSFFQCDADCVAFTGRVSEDLDLAWLDLLARSGTPLFVSASPEGLSRTVKGALRTAYAHAAVPRPISEPLDWQDTVAPRRWRHADGDETYDWSEFG